MEIIGLLFLLQYNLETNQYARKHIYNNLETNQYARKHIYKFIYSLYFHFNYTNSYLFILKK
jgi:hypothetical protein